MMALFGNLFEKKNCAICGKELGIFGKTKISEGYLCKDCAGKLSPYFHGHRSATVEDIRDQLSYREANRADVAAFHVTRALGNGTKVYLDEDQTKVIITNAQPSGWADRNPDVIDFTQVTGCHVNVDEDRNEILREGPDGQKESYRPPRFEYDYDVDVTIMVNSPYFDEIKVDIASGTADQPDSVEIRSAERIANEIHDALTSARQGVRDEAAAAAAP